MMFRGVAVTAAVLLAATAGAARAQSAETAAAPAPARLMAWPSVETPECYRPNWPKYALKKEMSGMAQVAVLVGADGKPAGTTLQHSSGHKVLDDASEAALMRCTFKPGTLNGKPVAMWMPVAHFWTFENGAAGNPILMKAASEARDGSAQALYVLAQMNRGTGRPPEANRDAVVLMEAAAEAGYRLAQFELGRIYQCGWGVPADMAKADFWFGQAVAQGETLAVERQELMRRLERELRAAQPPL